MKDYYISIPKNDGKTLSEIETILLNMGYSSDKRWNDWMRDSSFDCVTASKGGKYAIHYHKGEYDHDDIVYTHDQFIAEFGEKSATEKMLEVLEKTKYFRHYVLEYSGKLLAVVEARTDKELQQKFREVISDIFDLAEEEIEPTNEPCLLSRIDYKYPIDIHTSLDKDSCIITITPTYLY